MKGGFRAALFVCCNATVRAYGTAPGTGHLATRFLIRI
jgi:hypothetical protein